MLSIIVPTLGRRSLWNTIASTVDQLEEGDELIVVADTSSAAVAGRATQIVNDFVPAPIVYLEASAPASYYGNAQRDVGMAIATGTHLCFLDDDDVYEHQALDRIRGELHDDWCAHVFRARWGAGHPAAGVELWADPVVREQNIATPMVVLPNRPYSRSWMDGNQRAVFSDFEFLSNAIGECAASCWHSDVVATVRP